MLKVIWLVIALAAAVAWSFVTVQRTRRLVYPARRQPDAVPSAPMQRVVWHALVPTLALAASAAVIAWHRGIVAVWTDDATRTAVTLLLVASLAGYTYYIARLRIWLIKDDGTLDERDRAILAAAPAGQAPAMMVTMAAWMIYLTETFQTTHLVPSAYLYAMFWSLLLVSIIASLVGILVGYRRS